MTDEKVVKLDNVVKLHPLQVLDFPKEQEAFERICQIIDEYAEELSVPAVLGILELVKDTYK